MGILEKLKKKKSTITHDMDLPPLPSSEGLTMRDNEIADLPNLKPMKEKTLPPIDEPPMHEMPKMPEPMPAKVFPKPKMHIIEHREERVPVHERIKSVHMMPGTKSLFLKLDDYRAIMDGTNTIKKKLKEAEDIVKRLWELKERKDKELKRWQSQLEDIQRKLMYVDKTMFE